jgi:hypothetical protein
MHRKIPSLDHDKLSEIYLADMSWLDHDKLTELYHDEHCNQRFIRINYLNFVMIRISNLIKFFPPEVRGIQFIVIADLENRNRLQ